MILEKKGIGLVNIFRVYAAAFSFVTKFNSAPPLCGSYRIPIKFFSTDMNHLAYATTKTEKKVYFVYSF